jgi:uncharacterized membrane protein
MFIKICRITLAIIVICLSLFSLITQNFELMPYLLLFLAVFMLVAGLAEFQKDSKEFSGYISIIVSLFVFIASIKGFLLN